MSDLIRVESHDGWRELVLNRPDKKNALLVSMYERLTAALADAAADDTVHSVLFRGEGPAFCAGNDLGDFLNHPPTGPDSPVMQFLAAVAHFPKPLIAAVRGPAVGIGTTLLLHCDLAYADPTALFCMPFTQLGLVPEAGSSLLLARTLGQRRAAELLLLSERFGADRAERDGLINAAVSAEELLPTARKAAQRLAALPAVSVQKTKAMMTSHIQDELDAAMAMEGEAFVLALGQDAFQQAVAKFNTRKG